MVGYVALTAALAVSVTLDLSLPFDSVRFYIATIFFAASLPGLFAATKDNRFTNFLGDLTYPLYLVGNICLLAIWSGPVSWLGTFLIYVSTRVANEQSRGYAVTALVTAFVLVMATVVHFGVERPVTALFRHIFSLTLWWPMSLADHVQTRWRRFYHRPIFDATGEGQPPVGPPD